MARERIWELDFFRGVCILGVVIVHIVFDLRYFLALPVHTPFIFDLIADYGSLFFILLSGICVTLGHHSLKRGAIVLSCGLVISIVTYLVTRSDTEMVWFGILHLLGVCMLLSPLLKRLPAWLLSVLGIVIISLGYWFKTFSIPIKWLFPLGLVSPSFGSGDFFPLFPNLGFFMIGIILGQAVYKEKKSLLSKVNTERRLIRFFLFLGRHSLWIYLGHQPIVYGLILLVTA